MALVLYMQMFLSSKTGPFIRSFFVQDPLCNLSGKVDGLTEESSVMSPPGTVAHRF